MDSGISDYLYGVWGSASTTAGKSDDVFVVGGDELYDGIVFRYNGTSWSQMTIPPDTYTFYAVWGSTSMSSGKANDVFAVGSYGTIFYFNGTDWSSMATPPSTPDLNDTWGSTSMSDGKANDVFAVGLGGIILHYDGTDWSSMTSGTTNDLRGVWGSAGNDVFAVGAGGTILHYDGSAWSSMTSGTTNDLRGVWGSAGNDVFAVGAGGTILHYDGSAWSSMTSPTPNQLNNVWGSAGNDVFAVGNYGTILHKAASPPASSSANLSNLVLSNTTLNPTFDSTITSYTADVANSVANITVTPTVNESHATVKVNGTTVASGSPSGAISLSVGSNTITVVVTAQDTTTKTYTVTVTRAASTSPPPAPTLISPASNATVSILTPTLQWNASTTANSYGLQVAASSTFTTPLVNTDNITTTHYDIASGLSWNSTYYWHVRAHNVGGDSAWSAYRTFKTSVGPPPNAPYGLSATPFSATRIDLSWSDNSTDEAGFKIERKKGPTGTYAQIAAVGVNVQNYSNTTGLTANTQYYYRVRAYKGTLYSTYCDEVAATTLRLPPPVPKLASPLSNATVSTLTPTLAWNVSTDAVNYGLQVATSSAFTTRLVSTDNLTTTHYDIASGLSWNSRYYWRVNAKNDQGSTSKWSAYRIFKTALGPPPNPPYGLSATPVSATRIGLSWSDNSTDETGFKIERKKGAHRHICPDSCCRCQCPEL